MAITKIQTGGIPALAVTHDKLHTDMDLSTKTVTLPSAITDTITNKLPLAGGTLTGNVTFGDNNKAIFGAGSDLQIYHDGNDKIVSSSSYFILEGSNIILRNNGGTEDYAKFFGNGAVTLYHDNAAKLATTSTGIDVTGTVTSDGLTVDGAYSYLNGLRISGADTGNTIYQPTSDLSISSASGSISLKPSGTNILHATNTGVGIGSSPTAKFSVYSAASGVVARIDGPNAYSAESGLEFSVGRARISGVLESAGGTPGAYLKFMTMPNGGSVTERMRIRGDGNIHINSTTPDLVGSTTSLTIGGSSFGGDGMLSLQSGWGGATYGRLFASGGKLKIGNPQSNDIELYTANLTRMKIDASGRVTTPMQPAWNAAGSGWHTTPTAAVLPLGTVVMNIGNHYNGTNYRFTAPVAGVYQVNTIFYMEATGQVVLKKNGADYSPVDTVITGFTNEGANSELSSSSVCIYLSANDYIQVGARNGQTVRCYLGHTFFSGYLVG